MYRRICLGAFTALLLIGVNACEDVTGDGGLNIKQTGVVLGLAYVDRNGNGVLDPATDTVAANLTIRLVPQGGGVSTLTAVTGPNGRFRVGAVPVGEYLVQAENSSVPDSLRFIKSDSATVHVRAADSLFVTVNFSYPSLLVRDARTSAAGKRVFIEGVTLNALATFGDSTLFVADSTGTLRVTRVLAAGIPLGQRVRVLGTTGTANGQPTISNATVFTLGAGTAPTPAPISTNVASGADGGKLDANLVQISGAIIVGSQTNPTTLDVTLSVNDGSGLLNVVIDRQTGITTSNFVPGSTLTATGLLVPTATAGVFELRPRSTSDVNATFALVTAAEARTLPAGRAVTLEGVALNSWFVFGDSTVHFNDATGSIRATRVAPINLFTGDRIRLLGTLTLRDGQPILSNVTATVLGVGTLPAPQAITTTVAAKADAGLLDAALVKITSATISAVSNIGGDIFLTVSDGSGAVEVMLDKDIGFATAPYVIGAVLDVTGLLVVKTGGADWRLKPRHPTDIVVR